MKIAVLFILTSIALLSGCTSVSIIAPREYHDIQHVYIRENQKVIVGEFIGVLRDGFSRHGISSEVVDPYEKVEDGYVVTYTALQTWDVSTYLSHAEIRIEKNNRIIASAEYHLKGKGGLSLTKWASVKSKIDPVIDELIQSIKGVSPQIGTSS